MTDVAVVITAIESNLATKKYIAAYVLPDWSTYYSVLEDGIDLW